jgi:uncharacterized protein (TIGR00369 family)
MSMSSREHNRGGTVTRLYAYPRPVPAPRGQSTGLEVLRNVIARKHPAPPMTLTLDYTLVEVEEGRAVFEGKPAEWQYSPAGTVHGGWMATLLESAMGAAVQSSLPAGFGFTTIDIQIRYVRPLGIEVPLVRAEGHALHVGKRIASADGRLVDPEGKLYATATTSCIVTPDTT